MTASAAAAGDDDGDDDDDAAATGEQVLRTFWVAALAAIFAEVHQRLQECSSRWVVLIYFVLSLASFVAAIGVEIAIILESFKGTPSEPERRRNMPRYLTIHVVLGMLQVFCMVYGCVRAETRVATVNWDVVRPAERHDSCYWPWQTAGSACWHRIRSRAAIAWTGR